MVVSVGAGDGELLLFADTRFGGVHALRRRSRPWSVCALLHGGIALDWGGDENGLFQEGHACDEKGFPL